MKILTLIGTRPEIIRLSVIIDELDKLVKMHVIEKHVLVYTDQNFDYSLSGIFFDQLGIRKPDYYFRNKGYSFTEFLTMAMTSFEEVINKEKPDRVLVLGDTNSGLLSLLARKVNIPVFHMEAGSRSMDQRVPEEVNRKLIDHLSFINMPYTENSKQNLIKEGFDKNHVFKIGNPIKEVMDRYTLTIGKSTIVNDIGLIKRDYVLATVHRSENVDNKHTLINIVTALNLISADMKVVLPIHPRTKERIASVGVELAKNIIVIDPLGFIDFMALERDSKLLISDSGSVPETGCINGVPSLIIRRSTERQELIECGSCILTDTKKTDTIIRAYKSMISSDRRWIVPEDYQRVNVSDTVVNILLGEYNI